MNAIAKFSQAYEPITETLHLGSFSGAIKPIGTSFKLQEFKQNVNLKGIASARDELRTLLTLPPRYSADELAVAEAAVQRAGKASPDDQDWARQLADDLGKFTD